MRQMKPGDVPPALLLLGPTGAGKTPLGAVFERRGLAGCRCVHFDFGEQLRGVVARNEPDDQVSPADIDFLRSVLQAGALLEDRHFPIAERILRAFLSRQSVDRQTWVVLNGLPRHVGQAVAIEPIVEVRAVVCLTCSSEDVFRRIDSNVGGDRTERCDDDRESVRHKLEIFQERTAPLLKHYQERGVRVDCIEVTDTMTVDDVYGRLREMRSP